jgi:hypothetical protein
MATKTIQSWYVVCCTWDAIFLEARRADIGSAFHQAIAWCHICPEALVWVEEEWKQERGIVAVFQGSDEDLAADI